MSGSLAEDADPVERTRLAWQRTSLSMVGGAVVQFRLTVGEASGAVLALIALAGLLSVLTLLESGRGAGGAARGGRASLLLAAAVTLLLAAELSVVAFHG